MLKKILDKIQLLKFRYRQWKLKRKRAKQKVYDHIYPMW